MITIGKGDDRYWVIAAGAGDRVVQFPTDPRQIRHSAQVGAR